MLRIQNSRFQYWAFIPIFLSTLLYFASCSTKSDVVELNDTNFDQIVLKSKVPVLVEFYAPWCGYCQRLVPVYEQVASNLKDIAVVAKVDATVEKSLSSRFNIHGYPTIKLFSPDSSSPTDYAGQRTASSIVNFVINSMENYVKLLKTSASDQSMTALDESNPLLVVALFTNRSDVSSLYKSLAMRFKGDAIFYQISDKDQLCERYHVDSFPTLIVKTPHNQDTIVYDGKISASSLVEFIGSFVPSNSSSDRPQNVSSNHSNSSLIWKKIQPDELIQTLQQQTKLCVVSILDSHPSADTQNILDAIAKDYRRDKIFEFFQVQEEHEGEIATRLNLDSLPWLFVYNNKRKKMVDVSLADLAEAKCTMDRVIYGDATWRSAGADFD